MFEQRGLELLDEVLNTLAAGYAAFGASQSPPDWDAIRKVLQATATRLQDNFPYEHPLYAGQMLKPPHPVARLAYSLAMFINPNNHALDGGRASSAMEKEAVANLAAMFGMPQHLGHLTSGGTMANLEALWIAGEERPGVVLASEQAHYTHSRISKVLKLPFESVPTDRYARMDIDALETRLQQGGVSVVVATLGTTAVGAVDPLQDIIALARQYDVRVHVDAAYGGYFILANQPGEEVRAAFDAVRHADSIVIDPHKHGLQPYGCGCVLFRDPSVGRHYSHDSPYTYFSSDELHLGEISLECSRAGASAVALWATQKLLPMTCDGEFAAGLDRSLQAARALYGELHAADRWHTVMPPALDIVLFAARADSASAASRSSQKVFDCAAENDLHLALARFPRSLIEPWWQDLKWDVPQVAMLRSCLMKPEHLDWLPEIRQRLELALKTAG